MPSRGEDYWILSTDQLECLASSRRQAVLDLVATFGPVSANDLARLSGMKRTTLYQHIDKLLKVGLVLDSGHRGSGPNAEQVYRTPAPRMRLAKAMADDRNAARFSRIAAALLRQTERDIEAGMVSDRKQTIGPGTNLMFHRYVGAPSPETLAAINQKIEDIKSLIALDDPASGEPLAITVAMASVERA